MMLTILRVLTPVVYALATVLAARYFIEREAEAGTRASRLLLIAWILHSGLLVGFAFAHGWLPVTSWADALSLWMWMFALLYLIFEWRLRERSLGLIVIGLVTIGQAVACVLLTPTTQPPELLRKAVIQAHVFLALSSYSGFALSFVGSLLALLLLKELKGKQLKFFFSRLPALEFLDRLSAHSATVGLLSLTGGMILGLAMGPRLGVARWYLDPKFVSVFITWFIYAAGLVGRYRFGWWGRRFARLSVVGFVWILFSFVVVGRFLSGVHAY